MRIGVLRTQVPFVHGGAERHAANLVAAFREHGHEATEITLPFRWYPGGVLVDHVMAARLTDIERYEGAPIDLAVGLKFPAWLARHPNKVFWILHQHRQAYDLWEAGQSDLLHEPDGIAIREMIRAEDRAALGPAAAAGRVFANSANVAARLARGLGLAARPLYHPPPNAGALRQGPYGERLLAPGRINPAKRQALILEALALTETPVRLAFAGPADSAAYLAELKARAAALGLEGRVDWLGAIPDAELVRAYAEARAVVYTPFDEDYGYVSLEAMLAARALVVTADSGGPLEFVRDGVEGLVAEPEPAALARAFDRMAEDPAAAERMGAAGHARYAAAGIGWDQAVARLIAAGTGDAEGHAKGDAGPAEPAAPPMEAAPMEAPVMEAPVMEAPVMAPAAQTRTTPPPAGPAAAPELPAAPAPEPAAPDPATPDLATPDLDAFAAAVAPPRPAALPFADAGALMAAHRFDTWPTGRPADPGAVAYFNRHWTRYAATLALIGAEAPRRILDIGQFPPFLFQALLAHAYPGAALTGVWEGPEPMVQHIAPASPAGRPFTVSMRAANVERDPLPAPDASADLVLAMEILEHLAVDPLHFLAEIARVLAPGGRLVLTTPNIANHRAVAKILSGQAPYSHGPFVPTGGVYGRHNREYTPAEVAGLAEAAGLETERLATADLYERAIDPEVARLLAARGDDMALRGETILYVARRPAALPAAERAPALPEGLYHGEPRALAGRLTLLGLDRATGRARLAVENRSRLAWPPAGPGATVLYLEWIDADGRLVHGGGIRRLGGPLAPGATEEVVLQLDPAGPGTGDGGTLKLELLQEGAGRLSGTGRANRLALPCSEAAWLRLAGAAPA